MMELTRCEVVEITANSGPDVARFAWEKGESDSIRIAIIKPNGEILALRTETIYEGEEWLESLIDASKVRRHAGPTDNWSTWDANFSQLRRRSSSTRELLPNRGGRSGSTTSALNSERHSSIGHDSTATDRKSHGNAAAVTNLSPNAGDNDDLDDDGYDSDQELVEKDGSLLAWVQEDPRHAVIALLLGLIVYLASVMHRHQSVLVSSAELP
ncbi:hypothetical protein PF008_g2840 [Phytophthora fragariae]|nr:hypothetical protein PF008_g2840 [Phytophthora fragariae]